MEPGANNTCAHVGPEVPGLAEGGKVGLGPQQTPPAHRGLHVQAPEQARLPWNYFPSLIINNLKGAKDYFGLQFQGLQSVVRRSCCLEACGEGQKTSWPRGLGQEWEWWRRHLLPSGHSRREKGRGWGPIPGIWDSSNLTASHSTLGLGTRLPHTGGGDTYQTKAGQEL